MAIERLTIANYNNLDDKPILIGDLDAIAPEANTYYKHNGADETTYTKGVIYFFDGENFNAVGAAGGGTTLNQYTVQLTSNGKLSKGQVAFIRKIINQSKSYTLFRGVSGNSHRDPVSITHCDGSGLIDAATQLYITYASESFAGYATTVIEGYNQSGSAYRTTIKYTTEGVTVERTQAGSGLFIQYWNDTEITV